MLFRHDQCSYNLEGSCELSIVELWPSQLQQLEHWLSFFFFCCHALALMWCTGCTVHEKQKHCKVSAHAGIANKFRTVRVRIDVFLCSDPRWLVFQITLDLLITLIPPVWASRRKLKVGRQLTVRAQRLSIRRRHLAPNRSKPRETKKALDEQNSSTTRNFFVQSTMYLEKTFVTIVWVGGGMLFREHAKTLMMDISVIPGHWDQWSFWWRIYPSYGTQRVNFVCFIQEWVLLPATVRPLSLQDLVVKWKKKL